MEEDVIMKKNVYDHILKIKDAKGVYDLFSILGYPKNSILDISSKRKKSTFEFKKEDNDKIKEVFSVLNLDEKLPVFLLETTTLAPSFVRTVTNTFDKQYLQYLLIFTVNYDEITFVFPDKEKAETGKNKLKLIRLNVKIEDIKSKTAYYSVIESLANLKYVNEVTWRDVWRNWKRAFSVERVTESFFDGYKKIFFDLRGEVQKQNISSKESHEFTLQLLNRTMFIQFISKKDWLEKPMFVAWLWSTYRTLGKYSTNEFYEKWLKQMFFKAFNNRSNEIKELPDEVVKAMANAPYLNGGLFRENPLDKLNILITDTMFKQILEFFESYNFTIKEDMPLESEVAVDPQMIGYVYESLANVAEEIYDRNDLGIFYTPRVEVDFMCRRSLVEYLSKYLPELPKEKFYRILFDPAEEREKIEDWFTKNDQWRKLEDALTNLSVVDPACGSGAFLVGMLNVVSDLYKLIYKYINSTLSDFQLKDRIIQYSLYGVDVMPWAIHAAELRLWLQLIVETEFKKEDLRQYPLLPNLNLNLRVGDSLVQEIGGMSFNLRTHNLNDDLKRKLDELKQEKRKYFESSSTARFKTPEEVKEEEYRLFEEIIDERVKRLRIDMQDYENNIKDAKSQRTLVGEQVIDEKKYKENQIRIDTNNDEIEKLNDIKSHLKDPEKRPFIWDIDFAEIFGDKGGFDIVIGNPPYVNYKKISPPNKEKKDIKDYDISNYKDKLQESIKTRFSVIDKIDRTNDYYIYFYFHGLSLLNEKGTFCFITSNSWLDVDYGKNLQEFLIKYVPIIGIYDSPKKSFAHADVNTIIALFGYPQIIQRSLNDWTFGLNGGNIKIWPEIENVAKFVMFKKPLEEILSPKNLIAIENIKVKIRKKDLIGLVQNLVNGIDYRVFPIMQEDLLQDGWEYPDQFQGKRFGVGSYEGNKWGGRFLRAPDVYYVVLGKGKDTFHKLESIAYVRTGVKEGGYGEYIKSKSKVKNEEHDNFIPILKNVKEQNHLLIKDADSFIVKNIEKFKKVVENRKSPILWLAGRGSTHKCYLNPNGYTFSGNLIGIEPKSSYITKSLVGYLNSTLCILLSEVEGRSKGIGGAAEVFSKSDLKQLEVLNHVNLSNKMRDNFELFLVREVRTIFEETGIDQDKSIREQKPNPLPDRAELDNIIFNELGLTHDERKEVYWSVCELVKQRIDKARSLRD
jgi:hypothetical protein